MDLLGSILNSMDKPPSVSDKEKAVLKKLREDQEKRKKIEADMLNQFYKKAEAKVNQFLKDTVKEYKFAPMNHVHRSIIYDVAEAAGVLAHSFGEEDIDRHIILFKKEYAPSEDQLNVLRRGEEWNDDIAKKLQNERKMQAVEKLESYKSRKRKNNFVPNTNYKDKYEHLIGKEAALEAARKTEATSSYGCVPSENKKDQRSIEQTLADIRAKKKKLEILNEDNKRRNSDIE
ncbi:hypothetical protein PV325_009571 [Microctonus aethiopoides]|uniref:R3H domain-containing protein n=1 Tax=Microctonus aethiopoides TaxID=144406 RepID=A0AA39FWU6_9HYME|nr:hypothetical protein PV325_009571 [Microctonus aethiopoides]KAK0075390.1 hypothetical protein PV326_011627 [Microctonus aethiopoides]KAK0177051.1 hypothetical protein PV328_001134 [Microctonus aethiopoides]